MSSYFNIFECGKNILNILDMTYERACMATPRDKYYGKMLETIVDYTNAPLSNEKLRQEMHTDMEKRKRNNVTKFRVPIMRLWILSVIPPS